MWKNVVALVVGLSVGVALSWDHLGAAGLLALVGLHSEAVGQVIIAYVLARVTVIAAVAFLVVKWLLRLVPGEAGSL